MFKEPDFCEKLRWEHTVGACINWNTENKTSKIPFLWTPRQVSTWRLTENC